MRRGDVGARAAMTPRGSGWRPTPSDASDLRRAGPLADAGQPSRRRERCPVTRWFGASSAISGFAQAGPRPCPFAVLGHRAVRLDPTDPRPGRPAGRYQKPHGRKCSRVAPTLHGRRSPRPRFPPRGRLGIDVDVDTRSRPPTRRSPSRDRGSKTADLAVDRRRPA
jgi:hypothetical protein